MKIRTAVILCFLLFLCSGCKKKENTATSGSSFLMVSEPYGTLLQDEVRQFGSIYPDAHMDVSTTSTRNAVVQMLNDSVHAICIDRELNDEERQVLHQASMHAVENRIGDDAFAVLVHTLNPIEQVSKESLEKIVNGSVVNWRQIAESHWSGSIELVVADKNSGNYELLQKRFLRSRRELPAAAIVHSQQEVAAYVAGHPQSIGFVSFMMEPGFDKKIKVLRVEADSVVDGAAFLRPTQENVYQKLYPLRYSLYLYTTEQKTALGSGLTAFILTIPGQKIIQNAGIVPAIVPSRRIQLNAE
jgi:phosphate transport system substrate-binding protein